MTSPRRARLLERLLLRLVVTVEGCWEWPGSRDQDGYGIGRNLDGQQDRVHRIVWMLVAGRRLKPGEQVRHKVCDNPPCCRPSHLLGGTNRQNVQDRDAKGRMAWGERNSHARLTGAVVEDVRRRVAAGEPQAALGRELGVSKNTINHIVRGRTWRRSA